MIGYILPTADLIENYENLEEVFSFYDGGFKAVVRDLFLYYDVNSDYDVCDKIMSDYHESAQGMLDAKVGSGVRENFIEMGIDWFLEEIDQLLVRLFRERSVEMSICKHLHAWVGNDLVIYVDIDE